MSNQLEKIKKEFNNLIKLYQGVITTDNPNIEPLKEIMNIIIEYRNNSSEFCKIIKEHLKNDDTKFKIRLFHIIDTLFKSEVGDTYINQLNKYLYDNFKECFTIGDFDDRVLLFKIFYTWKYIIPSDLYEQIKDDQKLDDFKAIFMKKYPGKIKKYDDYNDNMRLTFEAKTNKKKTITTKNFKEDEDNFNNNDNINNNLTLKEPNKVKQKKMLGKKTKLAHNKSENENTANKKIKIENSANNNINNNINPSNIILKPNNNFNMFFPMNVSPNEIKLFIFLSNNQKKLNRNLPFFSSIAKFYSEALFDEKYSDNNSNQFKIINNNEEAYQEIRKKMKTKLFQETSKNNCDICGFRTLYYNDLVQHLDIHFYFNLLEMEGKNLFRKKASNKNNWIYGNNGKNLKNKNLDIGIGDKPQKCGTLENLIFYRNMMNNNFIKINNEQEEDNEEFMYPINDENRKKCHYCGDDFKKIFSTKYNYWFYNQVVVVIDDKNKFLVHQACFEELAKKFK